MKCAIGLYSDFVINWFNVRLIIIIGIISMLLMILIVVLLKCLCHPLIHSFNAHELWAADVIGEQR